MAPLFGDPAFHEVALAHDHHLGKESIALVDERNGGIPCQSDGMCLLKGLQHLGDGKDGSSLN